MNKLESILQRLNNYVFPLHVILTTFIITSNTSFSASLQTENNKTYTDVNIIEGNNIIYALNPVNGTIENAQQNDIQHNSITFSTPQQRDELNKQWSEQWGMYTVYNHKMVNNHDNVPIKKYIPITKTNYANESQPYPTNYINIGGPSQRNKNKSTVNTYNSTSPVAYQNYPKPIKDTYLYPPVANSYPAGYPPQPFTNPPYSAVGNRSSTSIPPRTQYGPTGPPTGYYGTNTQPYMPRNFGTQSPIGMGYNFAPPQGFGFTGYFRDVTSLSNISDLFSTIDDRLVGEFGYRTFIYIYIPQTRSQDNRSSFQGQPMR